LKDKLFALVKSLSPAEKKMVKLSARKGCEAYIQLFDALEKQKIYNETSFKSRYRNSPFTPNLPYHKNYLFNHILKSLRDHFEKDNIHIKLKRELIDAEILISKYKLDLAREKLMLVEREARKLDMLEILPEILCMRHKILTMLDKPQNMQNEAKEIYESMDEVYCKLSNLNAYRKLYDRMHRLFLRLSSAYNSSDQRELKTIKGDILLSSPDKALSVLAGFLFHATWLLIHLAEKDYDKAYESANNYAKLIEQYPQFKYEKYSMAMYYLLKLTRLTGRYEEYREILYKYRKHAESCNQLERLKIFCDTTTDELLWCIETKDIERGLELIEEVKAVFAYYCNLSRSVYSSGSSYYGLNFITLCGSVVYIMAERYNEALAWISWLHNAKPQDISRSSYRTLKVLNLIIHYELGNYEFVESQLKSFQRYLNRNNELNDSIHLILELFESLLRVRDYSETIECLEKFKLEYSATDPNYQRQLILDLVWWADRKIHIYGSQAVFSSV